MDKHVIDAKRILVTTLFELLETEPIDEISVAKLCEKSGIDRQIFYIHYSNVSEIFADYQNDLTNEVYQTLKNNNGDIETLLDTFDGILTNNVQELRELCLNQEHHPLIDQLEKILFDTLEDALLVTPTSTNDQLVLQYLASGLINSYVYWFDHPERINYGELSIINKEIIQANVAILK